MLIHILIGLTKKDNDQTKLDYIKILGFNKLGQQYLKDIRKDTPSLSQFLELRNLK